MLLTSTLYYKQIKKNFGQFKSIYIATFWTIGCIILPCVIYEKNYEILNYPNIYLPGFLSMFASSNLLDIKDIKEDRFENINTLPVIIGKKNSIAICHLSLLLSIILFYNNINFENNLFLSYLYELQNFATFFI